MRRQPLQPWFPRLSAAHDRVLGTCRGNEVADEPANSPCRDQGSRRDHRRDGVHTYHQAAGTGSLAGGHLVVHGGHQTAERDTPDHGCRLEAWNQARRILACAGCLLSGCGDETCAARRPKCILCRCVERWRGLWKGSRARSERSEALARHPHVDHRAAGCEGGDLFHRVVHDLGLGLGRGRDRGHGHDWSAGARRRGVVERRRRTRGGWGAGGVAQICDGEAARPHSPPSRGGCGRRHCRKRSRRLDGNGHRDVEGAADAPWFRVVGL